MIKILKALLFWKEKTAWQVFFLFVLLFFSRCEQEIYVDIPESPPKIVVNSLFTPDSLFSISVTKSNYIYDNDNNTITKAVVELFSGENTETLFHESGGFYRSLQTFPKQGEEYKIQVTADGFNTVFARDEVPARVKPISKQRIDNVGLDKDGSFYSEFSVTFKDPELEKNYYEIVLFFKYLDSIPIGALYGKAGIFSFDPVIQAEGRYNNNSAANMFFSDEMINGQEYNLVLNYQFAKQPFEFHTNYILVAVFNSISENYYKYLKKRFQYKEAENSIWNNTGISVQMFSNIENGFGIFAGYCSEIDTLYPPQK